MIIYILGRQPSIGFAELEAVYGSSQVKKLSANTALVDAVESPRTIGSAVKVAKLLQEFTSSDWNTVNKKVAQYVSQHLPESGKVTLGVSVYDFGVGPRDAQGLGLKIKQNSKSRDGSVRLIPNQEAQLSSAQTYHNKLTSSHKKELIIIRTNYHTTVLGEVTSVQNIDSYTLRDRGRPKRDARVGMLPPKLAQTIINLAAAHTDPKKGAVVLDPFCGTGVVLQEASLMGYDIYGSDLEKRMVDYSDQNLQWVAQYNEKLTTHSPDGRYYTLETADATSHSWKPFFIVACETYLGRPFTSVPEKEMLQKNRSDCDTIIKKFLENIHDQARPGTRFCLAVPAWFVGNQVYHLKTLDYLEEIGYNRISFVHTNDRDLIYHREDQVVGRELVVIIRK